jgi:CheY-like chemotaxis protein
MMTKRTSVILIDDDPFTLAMTKQIVKCLVKNGKIKTFCSAKDALSYLQRENDLSDGEKAVPGIILSDLHMPCMDGFQFLDEFARLGQAVRRQYSIFILSSSSDEKERARLFEKTSFEGFCSKPLTPGKFMGLIEQTRITL